MGDLGIYMDLNSTIYELDESSYLDKQRSLKEPGFKASRLNLSKLSDRMKIIEQSASRVMSLDATMDSGGGPAYPGSRQSPNVSFIG
eukprot:CAMPEP_0185597550 /NCGR_PEP_ID=MMETSP0434-20130131/81434_1 /TAXON_ID=626734 ORGANISM="Favella taraikaensis, Strain Fe Narragansett Bay" /NCGR_SAMPLE_ID=MMETSP0434 /ASSEMBLY_ACC=CAM_ASM_000379 /LENGTH=86 /DNA_ID=CAMNT_0028226297 /DNA_START=863 /DNA_END=1123 /DNA_ORIENTATION=-